jgi:asparagine synthase (glutamine-hydrolysing)
MPETTTALIGVGQLFPGTSLEIEGSRTTTAIRWNPWEFVSSLDDRSPDELAEDLRRTVQSCVSCWGRLYGKGLLTVSGGLDSSIVAACLRNVGHDLSLLTLTTDDPLGDERAFARTMASYLGRPVFEERYSLAHIDLNKSSVSHLPTPGGRVDAQSFDATALKIATDVGANAIFTGNGGDNVFCMSRSARSLADRYSVNGLSAGLLGTLRDICSLTGATALQASSQGIAAWRKAANGYTWREEASFITYDALEILSKTPIDHPWLAVPPGTRLPGKAAHVAMILRMHYSLDAYGERGGVPVLHPLASQPILELGLRIPTWYQCEGGYDRAVARKAFQQSLPASILERKGKGSPQGFMFEIFEQRRDEIRERLLEGFLAANRIIERTAIERALRPSHQTTGAEIMRLLMFVDTEAWINHWRSRDERSTGLPE